MHELTCTCHACLVIRAYLHGFNCGGPAGHPIACVCPQCAYARDMLRRSSPMRFVGEELMRRRQREANEELARKMGEMDRDLSGPGTPLPPGRVEPTTLEAALGFTVREGDTR